MSSSDAMDDPTGVATEYATFDQFLERVTTDSAYASYVAARLHTLATSVLKDLATELAQSPADLQKLQPDPSADPRLHITATTVLHTIQTTTWGPTTPVCVTGGPGPHEGVDSPS
jgi:hypothetical protein